MRYFTEEQIDEHINWFNDTFAGTVTRVQEINYSKTTFGPRISGLHKHTKLIEAESVTFNENKLIQEWVDEEIKYPYTPLDLGNRKYKQTIAKTGFTEEVIAEEKINFQLHTYRLLQEAAEWYLVRVFKDTNLLAAHASRIMINTRDMVLARKVSGDNGQYNTWAWNSDNLDRPWAYTGKLTKEQRRIRRHYLGSEQGYKKQVWKVKARK